MAAVLHGDAGVGVDAHEGDVEARKRFIYSLLQRCLKNGRGSAYRFAHIERPSEEKRAELGDAAGEAPVFGWPHLPVAPAHGDAGDAAVPCGLHVGIGVADHHRVFGSEGCGAERLAHDFRVGLERVSFAVSKDCREWNARKELRHQFLGARLELVGRHCHAHAGGMQVLYQVRHAGVGVGVHVDMGGVILGEVGEDLVDEDGSRDVDAGCHAGGTCPIAAGHDR